MSLINEALKKAQRQRAEETTAVNPPMPGGSGPVTRRGAPRSAKATLLIAIGAVALVVVSVILTVFLLNRPSAPPTVAAAPSTPPRSQPVEPPAPSPVVVAPPAPAPVPAKVDPVAVTPQPVAPAKSAPAEQNPVTSVPTPPPAMPPAETRAPAAKQAPAAPNPAAKQDERAHAYIDALRVTGIRASGNDSRVLMNERVYRVNDIVERTLGIRLVKVGTDSLTFVDQNGAIYVKYF